MQYNFIEFFKNIDLYALIDFVVLFAVLAIVICFFVYKRNIKVLILLLLGCALDILINILAELIGHSALEIARYITHFIVLFDIVAACVVYQNDLKNIFQKVSTSRNIELHNSNDELRFHARNSHRLSGYG